MKFKLKQCIFLDLVCIFWFEFCKCNVPCYVNWIINYLNLVKFFPHFILLFNFENCTELTWAWACTCTPISPSHKSDSQKISFFLLQFLNMYSFWIFSLSVLPVSVVVFYHGVCFKNGFNHIIHQISKHIFMFTLWM